LLGQRYSLLSQINTGNVKNLELQWVGRRKSLEKFETTSLVQDGILYAIKLPTTPALQMETRRSLRSMPRTGRPFWTFSYPIPMTASACCGRVNRGLAILGETLYMGTLDSHLIAVDAKIGN
jgi:alcohol dehydrogenase (cytochrome c)